MIKSYQKKDIFFCFFIAPMFIENYSFFLSNSIPTDDRKIIDLVHLHHNNVVYLIEHHMN